MTDWELRMKRKSKNRYRILVTDTGRDRFIFSDFKKHMGLPAESFKKQLETLQNQIQNNQWDNFLNSKEMFIKLQRFYEHQKEMLQGYEQDMAQLNNDTRLLDSWIGILQGIIDVL